VKRNANCQRPSPKQGPSPLLGPDLVGGVLEKLCLSADAPTVERLCDFGSELLSWSRRVDLCGARTAEDFASGPLFDALTLVPVLEKSGSLLDVGSGGGLPGLPALILRPALQLTLLEPRTRRAAFLRHICRVAPMTVLWPRRFGPPRSGCGEPGPSFAKEAACMC
jgi:16S rRNA G527 N7-methylase RsmG